jgi:hypothetical protein
MRTASLVLCAVLSLAMVPATALPPDEVPPPRDLPCFPGAVYRKAVSSVDRWTGIDATIVLPTLQTDPDRLDPRGRPRDNTSHYVGGRAGETEIDAGVLWEVIREPDGSVSRDRKAFRPFYRNEKWHNAPAEPRFYYQPGDTIRLRCWTEEPEKLKLRIDLLARFGQPTPPEPISTFEVSFDAPGFGPGREQEFKRVSAIDQTGNEGKPAQPTRASVAGATWKNVHLLRGNERRPMIVERFTDMRCPDRALVTVRPLDGDPTGELIDLRGAEK